MKFRIVWSAFLILSFACAFYAQGNSEAQRFVTSGDANVRRGDYDGAIADYTKAIELNHPDLGRVYVLRAGLYRAKKDYDRAWADATKALTLLRTPAKAFQLRGDIALDRMQWAIAIAEFGKALDLAPDIATTYVNRAVAHRELNDLPGALADLTKAIELTYGMSFAYVRRANIHRAMSNKALAYKDLDQAIANEPKSQGGYVARGHAHYADKNYTGALTDLNKALEIDPGSYDAAHYLGHVYYEQGDHARAIDAFTKAIKASPEAGVYLDRGIVSLEQNAFDNAERDFAEASKADPERLDASLANAWMAVFRSNGLLAVQLAEKILKKHALKGDSHYAVVIGYVGYLMDDADAEGKAFVKKWSASPESAAWPAKLIKFLNGQMTSAQLLKSAVGEDQQTEARTLIGTDAVYRQSAAIGRPHIAWVRAKGKKGTYAYILSQVIWDQYFNGPAKGEVFGK